VTIINDIISANGTYALRANNISQYIKITAFGGGVVNRGDSAYVAGNVLPSVFPIQTVVGQPGGTGRAAFGFTGGNSNGGSGYSGGGGGGLDSGGITAQYGPGGGGSTAVLQVAGAVLLFEAGGKDGTFVSAGGSAGGYASNAGAALGSLAGGSGGSQGGSGGSGSGSATGGLHAGGSGHGGGTNGNSASGGIPGAGVGSGGLAVAGYANSFADTSVVVASSVQYGSTNSSGFYGNVAVYYHVADAPSAPTLVNPTSGENLDGAATGITFTGTYRTPGSDTGPLEAVQLQLITGGTTYYWDGTTLTTTASDAPLATGVGALNGDNFTVVIPPGYLTDGVTYQYSFITIEAFAGLSSPAAAPVTFQSVSGPHVAITAPTFLGITTSLPTITWADTIPSGTQLSVRVVIYDIKGDAPPPPPPPASFDGSAVWDSGVQTGSSGIWSGAGNGGTSGGSVTVPFMAAGSKLPLLSVGVYQVYVQIVASTTLISPWATVDWIVEEQRLPTPTLTAIPVSEPTTAMPSVQLHATSLTPSSPAITGAPIVVEYQADYSGGLGEWQDVLTTVVNPPTVSAGGHLTNTDYDMGSPFNITAEYRCRTAVRSAFSTGGISYPPQVVISPWSNTVVVSEVPSDYWWIVPTTNPLLAMQIARLRSTGGVAAGTSLQSPTAPPTPQGLSVTIAFDKQEQMGVFRGFGTSTAKVVHGDIWAPEFDASIYLRSSEEYGNLDAIRNLKVTVLMKSDMEGSVFSVAIGPDFNAGIFQQSGRRVKPTRGVTVHCTPVDAPAISVVGSL
jgi:hypothetical protein